MDQANGGRETIFALPGPIAQIPPAKDVRGAMIVTSLTLAREHGLEAGYFEQLPTALHERVRDVQPTSWVPMELAVSHYWTMTRLFPGVEQQVGNGRISSERTQNAYLRTIVRALQATGQVNPLTVLKRMPTVLGRMLQGGGAAGVYSLGMKDARIELVNYPVLEVPYVRNAWQGMFESALSLAAKRVFIRQDGRFRGAANIAYDVSWV